MTAQATPHTGGRAFAAGRGLRRILGIFRERRARKRLAEIVASTRDSYAIQDYRKRRAAALKGMGRVS